MADNHSKETRSYNMSKIHSKNTKHEEIVRRYLFSRGLRDRIEKMIRDTLVIHPDIVLQKYKNIIFVNGCFWHMHGQCLDFVMPKSN